MNVAALQKHIRDLATFLSNAEAGKTVVSDLTAVSDALDPFRDKKVKEFTDFLKKAEEYARTGVLAPAKPAAKKPKAKKPAPELAPEVADARDRLAALYEAAKDASDEDVELAMGRLNDVDLKTLKVLAQAVGVEGKVKSARKPEKVVAEIRGAIVTRRAMNQRGPQ